MLAFILHIKLATATLASWMSAASPMPVPASMLALALDAHIASPVAVKLYDENMQTGATVYVGRDGTTDAATTAQLAKMFQCPTTGHRAPMAVRTMAMIADVADRWGKPLGFVSAHRYGGNDGPMSPHRGARALDFRIHGVDLREIRDYLWSRYKEVGIGWYPEKQFIHMDTRPGQEDMSWTYLDGYNHYHPPWSEVARSGRPKPDHRPGS